MSDTVCYWEKQGPDRLCAVHCLNALLQAPCFSAADLAQHAHKLDAAERALLGAAGNAESANVDASGNFSIGVIEAALKTRGYSCVNAQHPDVAGSVQSNPGSEAGYICNSHAREHWFTIRQVRGRWWDLDSLKHSPQSIGDVYLAEFLNATRQQGFTIFVVRGASPLPDPDPRRDGRLIQAHQHFLSAQRIEDLKKEGLEKERREAEEAQRIAGGGDPAGGAGAADDGGAPSFTVIAPADKRKKEETDWKSLGAGNRLDGGGTGAASGGGSGAEDAELQAALRASAMECAGAAGGGLPEVPEEPAAGGTGLTTIMVRLPNSKRLQRRFAGTEHTAGHLVAWVERASVEDASLGLPVLTACDYSLLKRGFPGGNVKIERVGGATQISGEEVTAKTLQECGFQAGQEALMLQL